MTDLVARGLRVAAIVAAWVSAIGFAAIFFLASLNVVGRYGDFFDIPWAADLQRLLFIWVVFFGSAAALHDKSHLAVDFLRDLLPSTSRRIMLIAGDVLLLVLLLLMLVYGWDLTVQRMGVPYIQLDVPQGYAFVALPISAALMSLFTIHSIVEEVRGRVASPDEVPERLPGQE